MADPFEKVVIHRNGDGAVEFDAFVTGAKDAPAVVVIQEWWGVDYETKNHAVTLASKGFRTLIPDLYRGKVALDQAEASHLMDGLDWQGAVKDIAASAKWLKENGAAKVGVLGFCMGGALSLATSVHSGDISACVAFYGIPPEALADIKTIKVPVQAHFGELDAYKGFSDVPAAKALEESLKAAGVESEVLFYPGQGHAFLNASPEAIKRKEGMGLPGHDQTAVELAWSRATEFLRKHLA